MHHSVFGILGKSKMQSIESDPVLLLHLFGLFDSIFATLLPDFEFLTF